LLLTVIRWLSPFWTALRSHRGCSTRRRGAARRCRHNAHEHRRRLLLFSLPLSLCFFLSPCGRLELIGETGVPCLDVSDQGLGWQPPAFPEGLFAKIRQPQPTGGAGPSHVSLYARSPRAVRTTVTTTKRAPYIGTVSNVFLIPVTVLKIRVKYRYGG
jgi:hypothetical protein